MCDSLRVQSLYMRNIEKNTLISCSIFKSALILDGHLETLLS